MSKATYTPPKKDFLGKPAPPGYIAGLGRGATGFTTRSDIGPARDAIASTSSDGFGRGGATTDVETQRRKMLKKMNENDDDDDEEESYLNESNYDEFAGYGGSLFSKDPYEDDDEEADKIYEQIDKHLDERGKALRLAKQRQEELQIIQERPKIQQQFSDLKAQLKLVTEEEWANIPEVGDARNRKQRVARQDKFTPVPDSLIAHQARLAMGGEKLVYIEPKDPNIDTVMANSDDEDSDEDNSQVDKIKNFPTGDAGSSLNIGDMSEFRGSVMSMKLSHSGGRQQATQNTPEDPKNYLTNLDSIVSSQLTDTATLEEYRKFFRSLRTSNPTLQNAWIASARLEEAAGKLKTARDIIVEGCNKNRQDVDLWCEAARLHPRDTAKRLMVLALKYNSRSVKLWLRAADLELDEQAKRIIYSKARELVPKSELLWKKSIEMERPEEARELLRQAVECCPDAVELWLALARLEPYEEAQRILVKASDKNPTARSIWIMAAKLEEAAGNDVLIKSIINLAIQKLTDNGIEIIRDEWFQEAIDADKAGFDLTCSEIIKRILSWKTKTLIATATATTTTSNEERLKSWLKEAEKFSSIKSINCARAVYECIVDEPTFAKQEKVWISYANLERSHANATTTTTTTTSHKALANASVNVKKEPGEDKINDDDDGENSHEAQSSSSKLNLKGEHRSSNLELVLRRSIRPENCIKSETLWLMLSDELKGVNLNETRQILSDALEANPDSERIILAAVELECDNHNYQEARRILTDACKLAKTPQLIKKSAKLEWSLGNIDEAIVKLKEGIEDYKDYPDFYLMLGQIEEQRSQNESAKTYYSNGLKFNPTSVALWISMASLEEKTGFIARARSKLELARKRNPKVPLLWLEAARLEMRAYTAKKLKASSSSSGTGAANSNYQLPESAGGGGGGNSNINARRDILTTLLAKGIRECKDHPDIGLLLAEQASLSRKRVL